MVSIKKVDASTFSKVYPLLQEFEEPSPDESGWRGIFEYQWEGADSCRGYGLFDKDEVVGFIGLIFSTRVIDGRAERFCNITSWIVRQPYRGHSLFLVRPLLKLQDHTLTDLTPSRIVAEILEQFGFKELDSGLHLLLPGKVLERSRDGAGLSCTHDREALAARLEGEDRRIYQDHLPYACRHLLAEGDRGPCYVVYTLVTGASSPYCHIQYVSDLGRFTESSLANALETAGLNVLQVSTGDRLPMWAVARGGGASSASKAAPNVQLARRHALSSVRWMEATLEMFDALGRRIDDGEHRLGVYGTGTLAIAATSLTSFRADKITCFFDDNSRLVGGRRMGRPIHALSEWRELGITDITFSTNPCYLPVMTAKVRRAMGGNVRIWELPPQDVDEI